MGGHRIYVLVFHVLQDTVYINGGQYSLQTGIGQAVHLDMHYSAAGSGRKLI